MVVHFTVLKTHTMHHILLIVPVARRKQKPRRFPLGLGYVAAALEKAGFAVRVLDLNLRRPSERDERRLIAESLEGIDAVGIGGMVTMFQDIKRVARFVKSVKNVPVVLGGPITRHFRELLLDQTGIDYLVAGEGELTAPAVFERLVEREKPLDVPGVAFQEGETVRETAPACRIRDLNELERPAYHLFDYAQYLQNKNGACDLISSRGCPHQCTFCHRNFGNRVALRSVESVIDEIAYLKKTYDVKFFYFQDELFVQHRSRAIDFCEALRRLGPTDWGCSTRVDGLTRDLLEVIAPAGCRAVMVGLESFSESMLKEMNKGATVEQNHRACELLNEFGVKIYPGLIIGMPGETEETVGQVVAACRKHRIRLTEWNYAFATPYPGTPLFEEAIRRRLFPDTAAYVDRICEIGDTCDLAYNLSRFDDATLIELRNGAIRATAEPSGDKPSGDNPRRPGMLARTVRGISRLFRRPRRTKEPVSSPPETEPLRSPEFNLPVVSAHFEDGLSRRPSVELFASSARMVEVEVFSFCNRRCWFCPNKAIDRRSTNHYMDAAVYEKILANLGEIDFSGTISFSRYNEPLADERIFSALTEARRAVPSATLHLNTNGDYLTADTVPRLYEAGLRSLQIQVYFSNRGEFDDSVAKGRIEEISKTLGLPCDHVMSIPDERTEYSVRFRDMRIRAYARNFERNGTDRGGLLSDLAKDGGRKSPCFVPFHDVYVDHNGKVMPCCNLRSDCEEHKPYILGDLSEEGTSLFSVFASEKAVWMRRLLAGFGAKPGPCATCSFSEVPENSENRGRVERIVTLLHSDKDKAAA